MAAALPEPADGDLRRRDVALYALPASGVTFLYSLVIVMYMNYGNLVLGVAPGALGVIFFVSKLWDAVSDPLVGRLSDRSRTRHGRRKLWLLASSVPLAVFSLALWAPPAALSGHALTAWIGVAVVGFYTAYTLFEVPHMALGAELTHASQARVRVFGARQLAKMGGLFAAFGIGAALLEDLSMARENAFVLAVVVGVASAALIVASVRAMPPERADYAGRSGESLLRSLVDVGRNRHARLLLFVAFIDSLAVGGIGALVPYVVRYVLKRPDLISEMLLVYSVPAVLAIPLWVRLARRYEKRRLWMVAMGMSCVGFGLLGLLGEGTVGLMAVAAGIAGIAGGCGPTLGQALKADVIDCDEFATGERKEGAYFAAWAFVGKVATGVMVGLVGIVLQWAGFDQGQEVSENARAGMLFLMGWVPAIGFGAGMWVFSRFSLTQAEHANLRAAIDARADARRGDGASARV